MLNYETEVKAHLHGTCGTGGFGSVLRATVRGSEVVLKMPRQEQSWADKVTWASSMELNILKSIPLHNNILRLLAVTYPPAVAPAAALVFPLANLGDLHRQQHLDGRVLLKIMLGVAQGLDHLHSHSCLHIDIKPSNILLHAEDGHMSNARGMLADFGLSMRLRPGVKQLTESTRPGTPGYQAPEVNSAKLMSSACDVYSLGVTLGEKVFALRARDVRQQFPGSVPLRTAMLLLAGLVNKRKGASQWKGCSGDSLHAIARLVWSCLAVQPAMRPSAKQVVDKLDQILQKY